MLTCKNAAKLISKAKDNPLSLKEQLGLRFHLSICSGCTNYNKQMDMIRKACRRFGGE